MAKLGTLTLTGASGQKYDFEVYAFDTQYNQVACVYAVTRREEKGEGEGYSHTVIYVGQTDDLSERFDDHHKADCFTRHRANAIGVHQDGDEKSRRAKEAGLIKAYNPPCND